MSQLTRPGGPAGAAEMRAEGGVHAPVPHLAVPVALPGRSRLVPAVASVARHWFVTDVLGPFLATRLAMVIVALFASAIVPWSPHAPRAWDRFAHPLLGSFSRWDGHWYLDIAANGYRIDPGGPTADQTNVAFFPLYPLLMRLAGTLLGRLDAEALAVLGILISNAALLIGAALLVRLVRLDHDAGTARRAVFVLFAFPTSFFLSAVYAEALFLALSVGALYAARRGWWWRAGLLGGLAALSRPHGLLVAIPLAVEYLHQHGLTRAGLARALRRPEVASLALVPAAVALYPLYLGLAFGEPLAFAEAQKGWGRDMATPWETLVGFFSKPLTLHAGGGHSVLDLGFAVFLLLIAAAAWRLLRPSNAALATAVPLAALSTGSLLSLMRVGGALFPVMIVLAVLGRHRATERLITVPSLMLGTLLFVLFARHYWVA